MISTVLDRHRGHRGWHHVTPAPGQQVGRATQHDMQNAKALTARISQANFDKAIKSAAITKPTTIPNIIYCHVIAATQSPSEVIVSAVCFSR